jgi:transaldolase
VLRAAGARPQRPLWAGTGTMNPAYPDVLYVEELIAPDVVNAMPETTLQAFADHGEVEHAVNVAGAANSTLRRAYDAGINVASVTSELERTGVHTLRDSYSELLDCIATKVQGTDPVSDVSPAGRSAPGPRFSGEHRIVMRYP